MYNIEITCVFLATSTHLFGCVDFEPQAMQLFYNFVSAAVCDPEKFMGVSLDQIPIIEKLVELNIFIYDFDIDEV